MRQERKGYTNEICICQEKNKNLTAISGWIRGENINWKVFFPLLGIVKYVWVCMMIFKNILIIKKIKRKVKVDKEFYKIINIIINYLHYQLKLNFYLSMFFISKRDILLHNYLYSLKKILYKYIYTNFYWA